MKYTFTDYFHANADEHDVVYGYLRVAVRRMVYRLITGIFAGNPARVLVPIVPGSLSTYPTHGARHNDSSLGHPTYFARLAVSSIFCDHQ